MKSKFFPDDLKGYAEGLAGEIQNTATRVTAASMAVSNMKALYDYSRGGIEVSFTFSEKSILGGKLCHGEVFLSDEKLVECMEKMDLPEYEGADPHREVVTKMVNAFMKELDKQLEVFENQ